MRRLGTAIILFMGSAAAAAEPASTLLLPSVALDAQVPPELAPKLDELTAAAFGPRAKATAAGRSVVNPLAPIAEARQALQRGRNAYRAFKFKDAAAALEGAAQLVEDAGVPPGDRDTWAAALIEAATANDAAGAADAARADCERLMTAQPSFVIDRVHVPPSVVQACETARAAATARPQQPLVVTSTPPLASVYVDGASRGTTPATIKLGPGRHWLLVVRDDREPVHQVVDVADTAAAPLKIDLPGGGVAAEERVLRAQLARRGPLPDTAESAAAVARAANVDQVLATAIEAGRGATWRVLATAVSRDGTRAPTRVFTLQPDLSNATEVTTAIAASFGGGSAPPSSDDERAARKRLDFERALFGVPVSAQPQVVVVHDQQAPPPPKKRTGLIVGLTVGAALVAGGVATGLALGLRNPSTPSDQWVLHVAPR